MSQPQISPSETAAQQRPPLLAPGERCPSKSTPNRISPTYTLCLANLYRSCPSEAFLEHVREPAEPSKLNRKWVIGGERRDIYMRQLDSREAALRKSYDSPRSKDFNPAIGPNLNLGRHSSWAERGILTNQRLARMRKHRPVCSRARVFNAELIRTLIRRLMAGPGRVRMRASSRLRIKRRKLVADMLDGKSRFKRKHDKLWALRISPATGADCWGLEANLQRKEEMKWWRRMRTWRMPWGLGTGSGMQGVNRMVECIGNVVYGALGPISWIHKGPEQDSMMYKSWATDEESLIPWTGHHTCV